jgi:hypothetical protein
VGESGITIAAYYTLTVVVASRTDYVRVWVTCSIRCSSSRSEISIMPGMAVNLGHILASRSSFSGSNRPTKATGSPEHGCLVPHRHVCFCIGICICICNGSDSKERSPVFACLRHPVPQLGERRSKQHHPPAHTYMHVKACRRVGDTTARYQYTSTSAGGPRTRLTAHHQTGDGLYVVQYAREDQETSGIGMPPPFDTDMPHVPCRNARDANDLATGVKVLAVD